MKWRFGPLGWGPFRVDSNLRVRFGIPLAGGVLTKDDEKKKVTLNQDSEPLNLLPLEIGFLIIMLAVTVGLGIGLGSVLLGL